MALPLPGQSAIDEKLLQWFLQLSEGNLPSGTSGDFQVGNQFRVRTTDLGFEPGTGRKATFVNSIEKKPGGFFSAFTSGATRRSNVTEFIQKELQGGNPSQKFSVFFVPSPEPTLKQDIAFTQKAENLSPGDLQRKSILSELKEKQSTRSQAARLRLFERILGSPAKTSTASFGKISRIAPVLGLLMLLGLLSQRKEA